MTNNHCENFSRSPNHDLMFAIGEKKTLALIEALIEACFAGFSEPTKNCASLSPKKLT